MELNLTDHVLTIGGVVSHCRCKCKHCLLSSGNNEVKALSYAELEKLALKFVGFKEKHKIHPIFAVYNCSEFDQLGRSIGVNQMLSNEHAGYQNLNGTKIRKSRELIEWVKELKSIGVTNANLTWFGIGKTHDNFVSRTGYFNYISELASELKRAGIPWSNSVFIMKSNLRELEEINSFLKNLGGDICYSIPDYRGDAKLINYEFIVEEDIPEIPDFIMDSGALASYLPEYKWKKQISTGKYPTLSKRIMFLTVNPENVQEYMNMDWGDILRMFHEKDKGLQNSIPGFEYLAEMYGDGKGRTLYNFRSIIWKWIDRHFSSNPKLDKSVMFSDLKTSVMWK